MHHSRSVSQTSIDFKFQQSKSSNNLNCSDLMEERLHFNHMWTDPFAKSSGEITCSPVSDLSRFCRFHCITIHRHCIYTCHSHTAYSVRYASCGLAQAFKRQWNASWVPSYLNAKGANKIKYGSPPSVWYQSIFLWSKVFGRFR